MAQFLAILSLYYACDLAAANRPLTSSEVLQCMEHYDAVKSYFHDSQNASSTLYRGQTNSAAYTAFKAWEENHLNLVSALKSHVLN